MVLVTRWPGLGWGLMLEFVMTSSSVGSWVGVLLACLTRLL